MTPHDELLDSVAAYALGVLPPSEAAGVEAHLQTCAQCQAEYRELRPAVTAVAYSAEACADPTAGAVAASPLLKARIMRRVRAEAASRPSSRRYSPAYALAAACLAIAIITGLMDLSLSRRLNRELAQSAAQTQTIADLTAADSRRYHFSDGMVVMRADRVYLMMHDMHAPPPGHVYQAWTLAHGAKRMAPSMTFAPGNGGVAFVRLPESATNIAAIAVSVEPDGGSLQPTTKPIAVVRI
ncbi:MAG: anti-sigma factor [Candidatus Eremiobacteraeota bacterium]|nr:anti-sigma factor [Candidatus Eremiobacteraeota bacterium]